MDLKGRVRGREGGRGPCSDPGGEREEESSLGTQQRRLGVGAP